MASEHGHHEHGPNHHHDGPVCLPMECITSDSC
jgi:hypothetical protein